MARPSETAQVDIGPDEIVKSNSCSNGSYMIDVSLSDLPSLPKFRTFGKTGLTSFPNPT
jgi:hypothetical protein